MYNIIFLGIQSSVQLRICIKRIFAIAHCTVVYKSVNHAIDTGHVFNFKNITITHTERYTVDRLVLESLMIYCFYNKWKLQYK